MGHWLFRPFLRPEKHFQKTTLLFKPRLKNQETSLFRLKLCRPASKMLGIRKGSFFLQALPKESIKAGQKPDVPVKKSHENHLCPPFPRKRHFKDRTEKIRRNSSADFFSYTMPESRSSSSHRFSAAYGTKRFRFDGMRP
jgi:hypothetical protein